MKNHTIISAEVFSGLDYLPDKSMDFAVTSPPYWGQRDYGIKGQIGNEKKPEHYIEKLTLIFSLLRSKLSDDGVFFLNVGDKYLPKYGKTPLAMIPYRLAYSMKKDGWFLEEVLIWYKPNHMPSSIKNRFVNSYEPIFVFTKKEDNIYSRYVNKLEGFNKVLKINLQPTLFKHIATYPEKLVEKLLGLVEHRQSLNVLDPFAGSGTTLKAVQNKNLNYCCTLIDNNPEYIDIIVERCKLKGNYQIIKLEDKPYYEQRTFISEQLFVLENQNDIADLSFLNENGLVHIAETPDQFYQYLTYFKKRKIVSFLRADAVSFLGCKEFDIDLIYRTSFLLEYNWIIRNMIVVETDDYWFPVFMIVDDNKLYRYKFNYKCLALKSKNENTRKWKDTDFVGYKVLSCLDKKTTEGTVVEILEYDSEFFPRYLIVKWGDNNYTKEYVIKSQDIVQDTIVVNKDHFTITEKYPLTNLNNHIVYNKKEVVPNGSNDNKNYKGKYKNEKRINWGASPGARKSVEQEYFSLQRLYIVDQPFVTDYLNSKRLGKGMSKTELTKLFPPEYKHTVGHWLRKDFGGSLPNPTDWQRLCEILDVDENFTNYVCKTALKLQTVTNGEYKAPDDFLSNDDIDIFKKLVE